MIFLKLLLWVKPCARCFTALSCQISPPFVACCTPNQHPEGTGHLATITHDLGPLLWAGRFLQEAQGSIYKGGSRGPERVSGPWGHPAGTPGDLISAFCLSTTQWSLPPTENGVLVPLHFPASCPEQIGDGIPFQRWDHSLPLCPSCLPP